MVHFMLQGPNWFYGLDSIIEIVASIIALLIVIASLRYARLAKEKRYGALGGGFLLIVLSFVSQFITSLVLYHEFQEVPGPDTVVEITNTLFMGHVAYVLFFIAGLLVLAIWALRIKENIHRAFLSAIVLFLAVVGIWNALIYEITSLLLLIFICAKFLANANQQRTCNAWEVLGAFVLLTISRLAFVLEPLHPAWYVGGHVAQLFGFLILLLVLIQVVRK